MSILLADMLGGVGTVAAVFLGGTVLAFVAGIVIAMIIRHAGWAWVSGPILALLATGALGWQNFRAAYVAGGSGPSLNIDTAPGLPSLIFLFVVFLYLTFWIGMGTLAGREFREYLGERKQGVKKGSRTTDSSL